MLSGTGSFSNSETITEQSVSIAWDEDNATVGVYNFSFYATTDCVIAIDRKYDLKKGPITMEGGIYINSSDLLMLINNTNIEHFWCAGVEGALDVSVLPTDTTIILGQGYIYGSGIYGDITPLLLNTEVFFYDFFTALNVTADISQLPNISELSIIGPTKQTLSWKTTRNSSYRVICFWAHAVDFGTDLDAMLINQANCQPTDISNPDQKKIMANGTKTPASDAAVSTLKGMGLTVIINGETL